MVLGLAAIVVAAVSSDAGGRAVVFEGFADASALLLNGDAATASTDDGVVLRLTAAVSLQQGGAFSTVAVDARAFSTYFTFRLSDAGGGTSACDPGPGGDGLVFVVQRGATIVPGSGAGIGYSGIANSVGVEWDTWCNEILNDPDSNHIGIDIDGNVDHGVGAPFAVGVTPRFSDGNLWHAWIDYDGTTLEVRTNQSGVRPEVPDLVRDIDIPAVLGQDVGFVGFTSGTGGAWANHDIVFWEYAGGTTLLTGKKLVVSQKKSGMQRLVVVAKDDGVGVGVSSPACQSPGELVVVAEGAGTPPRRIDLEPELWRPIKPKKPARGCRYRGESVVAKLVLKDGRMLKLVAKGPDLGIPLTEDPTPVRIALSRGGVRQCLRFGDDVRHRPGRKLRVKGGSEADRCPTVTTTSTTTTTLPEGDFFNDCINVSGFCDPREICVSYVGPGFGVCSLPCQVLTDCPAALVETAPVRCEALSGFPAVCVQTCATFSDCPPGMACFNGGCFWQAIR
jgi:hypothetical protein